MLNAMFCAPWVMLFFCLTALDLRAVKVRAATFTMGYFTGSQRRPGNKGYPRPGLTISGAISLAVEEINDHHPVRHNHTLSFTVAETYGEESESILQTAILWTKNISVYIGPQETCVHEARMAASFNLPMISYVLLWRMKSEFLLLHHLGPFYREKIYLRFWNEKNSA